MGQTVTIFLDAHIIIYQVEAVAPFQQKVVCELKELVREFPRSSFAVSRLSQLECLVKPVREGNRNVIERYRAFFSATDLRIVEVSAQVIEKALQLRASCGLRTPDAIQAASAVILDEPHFFVTGDKAFATVPGLSAHIVS